MKCRLPLPAGPCGTALDSADHTTATVEVCLCTSIHNTALLGGEKGGGVMKRFGIELVGVGGRRESH